MKVACEVCNRAVDKESEGFKKDWRALYFAKTYQCRFDPLDIDYEGEGAYLCPECLKTIREFIFAPDSTQMEKEAEPDGEAIEH